VSTAIRVIIHCRVLALCISIDLPGCSLAKSIFDFLFCKGHMRAQVTVYNRTPINLDMSKEFGIQQEGARNGLLEVYKIADKVDINWFIVSISKYEQFANKVLHSGIGDGFYFYGSPITIIDFFTDS